MFWSINFVGRDLIGEYNISIELFSLNKFVNIVFAFGG